MDDLLVWLIPLFSCTAFIYATVGFGGGSTYLALLYLAGIDYVGLPIIALICNIIVVIGNSINHTRHRSFEMKLITPFLLASIPFSFLGGLLPVNQNLFLWILGVSLLVAALRLLLTDTIMSDTILPDWRTACIVGIPTGAALGLLSGITGLGGGIFLAPILYLLRWGQPRQIAASASLFILFNSVSGLIGQILKSQTIPPVHFIVPLAIAVAIGGIFGTQMGYIRIKKPMLQRITAVLILFVSLKILWEQFLKGHI